MAGGRNDLSRCIHLGLILSLSPQFTVLGVQAAQATLALPPPSSTRPVVRNGVGLGAACGGAVAVGGSWVMELPLPWQGGWFLSKQG